MNGLCQCGCGQLARIAPVNDKTKGWVKGKPLKFLKGHSMLKALQTKIANSLGNKSISPHGYVVVHTGSKQRKYEHILVAEKALGRALKNFGAGHPQTEVVHHVNGIKTDNRPDNLLICTHAYHTALHHRLEASPAWPEFPRIARNVGGAHG